MAGEVNGSEPARQFSQRFATGRREVRCRRGGRITYRDDDDAPHGLGPANDPGDDAGFDPADPTGAQAELSGHKHEMFTSPVWDRIMTELAFLAGRWTDNAFSAGTQPRITLPE